jgi:hypothetical protein
MGDNPYQSPDSLPDPQPFEPIDERVLARWGMAGVLIGGAIAGLVAYLSYHRLEPIYRAAVIGGIVSGIVVIVVRMQFRRRSQS